MYETDKVYIVILLEGSKQNVQMAVEDLHQHFASISPETMEETTRHRNWLKTDIGALPSRLRSRYVTMSFRLITPPPLSLFSGPEVLKSLKEFEDRWQHRVTIVSFHIDTRTVPEATASVTWTAQGKVQSLIGSLGNNRGVYFRIMRHFFYRDDMTAFFHALTTDQIVPIPYQHKQQWSTTHSPLRLEFRNQDPYRNGLGLGPGPGPLLVTGEFLPADDIAITIATRWIDGLTILLHAHLQGILPAFDQDGQLTVSGYAMYAAGVVDANLQPAGGLTDAERRQVGLANPPTEAAAMRVMLSMYCDWLIAALEQDLSQDLQSIIAARLRDHLESATKWLSENRVRQGPDQAG